ncbi:DUF305 domain-containing protein [Nocardioides sp. T2.26MG-1]|uniref:DUF305 domain-containing protein n=1 Tax=Nocardioides sp. T2.26MG-1 TaxID=3041166 RepID=UPI0024779F1C|nr:DUF305 domain-containing protein [Nocardioides sp. T2.26MG-1]CAI9419301.1 hypothetical protein HIDPHFAB_03624 [Nocardioides sp. T2.26MG-1]
MTSPIKAAVLILVVGLVAAVGVIALRTAAIPGATASTYPTDGSADAGFARDMQAHHAQAVEMSFLILDRSEDRLIRTMALDIAMTQQQQVGQMHAWLEIWGLPQTGADTPMTWAAGNAMSDMGHSAMPSPMPGMATPAQMARLREATGRDAEILWLKLMLRHHRAGVDMASAALDLAARSEVRQLATAVVASQQSEIDIMQQLLEERTL